MNSWFHDQFREGEIMEWALPIIAAVPLVMAIIKGTGFDRAAIAAMSMLLLAALEMHRYRRVSDKITKAADEEIRELKKKISKLEDEVWELKRSKHT